MIIFSFTPIYTRILHYFAHDLYSYLLKHGWLTTGKFVIVSVYMRLSIYVVYSSVMHCHIAIYLKACAELKAALALTCYPLHSID